MRVSHLWWGFGKHETKIDSFSAEFNSEEDKQLHADSNRIIAASCVKARYSFVFLSSINFPRFLQAGKMSQYQSAHWSALPMGWGVFWELGQFVKWKASYRFQYLFDSTHVTVVVKNRFLHTSFIIGKESRHHPHYILLCIPRWSSLAPSHPS